MRVVAVTPLALPGVQVVRFWRFRDARGYFTEPFRRSVLDSHQQLSFLRGVPWVQANESFSRKGTVRGLHFQWNPHMGKLVRTLHGHMVDLALDIRRGSPTFGQAILYDMPAAPEADHAEWIWIPPGFAHGNFFPQESRIEYLCSGEYSPGCEAGISALAPDIDWSLADPELKRQFDALVDGEMIISDKDRAGLTLSAWSADERSAHFYFAAEADPSGPA